MGDEYPGETSPAVRRYAELDDGLAALRRDGADDHAVLDEMDGAWNDLTADEQEWFEYRSFRRAAAEHGDNVERKLAQLFKVPQERDRARRALDGYGRDEPESERVRLAVLKLSVGHRGRIAELVESARKAYRDVVARAEHPAAEYWEWLRK
jgi:hypothetical protein